MSVARKLTTNTAKPAASARLYKGTELACSPYIRLAFLLLSCILEMLAMLGFAPPPLGKKAQMKAQKQATAAHVPRMPVQAQALPSHSAPPYYILAETQRTTYTQTTAPMPVPMSAPSMPARNPSPPTNGAKPAVSKQQAVAGNRQELKAGMKRPFAILPTSNPDSFVYERSEDAQSDILTNYSSSSLDTDAQSTGTSSTIIGRPDAPGHRNSVLMITNAVPGDALSSSTVRSPAGSPRSQPIAVGPLGRPLARGEDIGRPRKGSDESSSSRRRGSGSDQEVPVISQPGPSSSRSSPPHKNGALRGRAASAPLPTAPPREVPQRRLSDSRLPIDGSRSRRLSGAVMPSTFGERSPPKERDVSPPAMRRAPSSDGARERSSPEREFPSNADYKLERRVSGTAQLAAQRERTPMPRSQYSSGSQATALPQRERYSPQEESPPRSGFPAPGPIRSRTLSFSKRGEAPKQIVIAGMEASFQGPSRSVRFSEQLICPSPIPPEQRRKGWFNKRGDQLWTNDGMFLPAEPGAESPYDLNDYPERGTGWMNEDSIRIDMQHRLIPKAPLRPALKRSNTSNSSNGTQQQLRPEARFYTSATIREHEES